MPWRTSRSTRHGTIVVTGNACIHLSSKNNIQIVRRFPLSENVLPLRVTVVRHAVREGPNLGVGPVFRQREGVL